MTVLIVVAHPDDEILGCGATAATLTTGGRRVVPCLLSGDVNARQHRPDVPVLHEHARAAATQVGMDPPRFGPFPNLAFNTVPHLELVQFIEACIADVNATTIFTHHPHDLNDDHLHVSRACQAAARLFQRRPHIAPLQALYYMEVPSSTDWAFAGTDRFSPDTFVPLSAGLVDHKLAALREYAGVMRPSPHPRSDEAIRALATLRGTQAGVAYAEAFQTAFRLMAP